MKSQGQLKELQMQASRVKMEIKQLLIKIASKTTKYEELYHEQEVSMKMDINLNSLKKLREV